MIHSAVSVEADAEHDHDEEPDGEDEEEDKEVERRVSLEGLVERTEPAHVAARGEHEHVEDRESERRRGRAAARLAALDDEVRQRHHHVHQEHRHVHYAHWSKNKRYCLMIRSDVD